MHAERWGASVGLEAGHHYEAVGQVVQKCRLLKTVVVVVAPSSLQLGSRDLPWDRGEVPSWNWVDPLVGELCYTAMLGPWAAAAGGLGSNY